MRSGFKSLKENFWGLCGALTPLTALQPPATYGRLE
jgi:hypothetical protein